MKIANRKGAMEMSVGTIVTIVLLVTVLVLGLVLVRTIFTGAKYNVDIIDEKIREQINTLFSDDKALVVHLPNRKAEIKLGEEWGIAWAVKNLLEGTQESSRLTYEVIASETTDCGITELEATNYIKLGQKELTTGIPLSPGQVNYEISRIIIPTNAPICSLRYRINTWLDGKSYQSSFFDVIIKA